MILRNEHALQGAMHEIWVKKTTDNRRTGSSKQVNRLRKANKLQEDSLTAWPQEFNLYSRKNTTVEVHKFQENLPLNPFVTKYNGNY